MQWIFHEKNRIIRALKFNDFTCQVNEKRKSCVNEKKVGVKY